MKQYKLSAERWMIKNFPRANPFDTVAQVERMLIERTKEFETINYIYVINEFDRLVGIASIKEIFRSPKEVVLKNLMATKIISVHPGTHQEQVAILALRHNLKAIPVVDKEGKLEGIVPSDAILNILHEEHAEDTLKSAGIVVTGKQAKDIIFAPAFSYFKKRIPWLFVGLMGGVGAAFMIGGFESALKEMLTLAAFIPAIVYMADAVGGQAQTMFIRSLAIERSMGVKIKRYIMREIIVSAAIAFVLSFIIAVISFLWWEPAILGVILGLSFFAAIIIAAIIAIAIPWIFFKLRIDPAIASGPFATVIRDILSLVIYLAVASFILKVY